MDSSRWRERLEAEIARELGQSAALSLGGEPLQADQIRSDRLDLPGARLVVSVDGRGLAGFLEEARLIDAAQSDAATVHELWTGILAGVAARLGGRAETLAEGASGEPCSLRLGTVALPMAIAVESAEVPDRQPSAPAAGASNYDLLLEIELDAAVRFGSRELELRELLELGPGDVLELDRRVADPVDLIVGDKIIARGEVVLVNGNFGLRVTEVAEPMRRLESIRCLT